MKNLITPPRFLVLSFTLMLFSCTTVDLENLNHEDKAGIKSKKITFSELQKHTEVFNLVNEFNQKQNGPISKLNKNIKNRTEPFTVDTHEGLYLEYANLHSFTFPIHREIDNGKLENLVFSYQNDGSYKIKILKYDLTPQEKIDLKRNQLKTIQNPVITIPINTSNTHFKIKSCDLQTQTIWVSCSQGVHNSSNINDWAKCDAGTPPRVYTVSRINCLEAGGSGTGGGGDFPVNGGFTYGSGGGSGGVGSYSVSYPTPQTNPEEYEQGISTPINPSIVGGSGDSSTISAAQAIEDKIDDSKLDPCPKGIMEKLKNTENKDIAYVFNKLGANSIYNVDMKMGSTAQGYAQTQKVSTNNYLITVANDSYTSSTQLFRAAALIHEIIHAYYHSVVDDNKNPTTTPLNNFPALYQAYELKKYPGGATVAQHDQMAKDYVDAMALALQEYYINNQPLLFPLASYEVFTDLAWGTLQEASIFNEKYKDGDPAKERILNRYRTESTGQSVETSTIKQQNPIGEPCN